jgi:hypothetical protein
MSRYTTRGRLWRYSGQGGGWYFITLSARVSAQIRAARRAARSPWGSVRVIATVGKTRWKTSVFPDSKSGRYLLPVKAQVRASERLEAGDVVRIVIADDVDYAMGQSIRGKLNPSG